MHGVGRDAAPGGACCTWQQGMKSTLRDERRRRHTPHASCACAAAASASAASRPQNCRLCCRSLAISVQAGFADVTTTLLQLRHALLEPGLLYFQLCRLRVHQVQCVQTRLQQNLAPALLFFIRIASWLRLGTARLQILRCST